MRTSLFAASVLVAGVTPSLGVIVLESQGRNTDAPTGTRLDAWNLQGQYGIFNGTPISPTQFIVAKHIGGQGGIIFRGQWFPEASSTLIAGTDLRVCTIGGSTVFPAYAALYDASVDGSEVGKPLTVFGRGTSRGAAMLAPLDPGATLTGVQPTPMVLTGGLNTDALGPSPAASSQWGELRGWRWGVTDAKQSWGQNVVDSIAPDATYGDLLSFDFDGDATRVPNEAIVSVGDSSGGVFILSNGVWKLAGVNLGVDGAWSETASGKFDHAAVFDARGLWIGNSPNHSQIAYSNGLVAASSYASRISSNLAAIQAITGGTSAMIAGGAILPEPAMLSLLALVSLLPRRRCRSRT